MWWCNEERKIDGLNMPEISRFFGIIIRMYTHRELILGISGQVWSWNARTRLPEILIFRLNKTRALVMLRLIGAEHSYL